MRHPAPTLACAIALGVPHLAVRLLGPAGGLVLGVLTWVRLRGGTRRGLVVLGVLAGWASGVAVPSPPAPFPCCTTPMRLTVLHMGLRTPRGRTLRVQVDAWGDPPQAPRVPRRLPLHLPADATGTGDLAVGARIQVLAQVTAAPLRGTRPFLRARVVRGDHVHVIDPPAPWRRRVEALRHHVAARLARGLPAGDAGMVRALLLGDRGEVDPADRARIRAGGQAHLLAVSGMHVALLAGALLVVLHGLTRRTWLVSFGLGVGIWGHVLLAGSPPSAVRAGCGLTLALVARHAGRRIHPGDVLAALVLLAFVAWHDALAEPGLLLSLLAVSGILLLGPAYARWLVPPRIRLPGVAPPRGRRWREGLAVSLGAWSSTLPVVMAVAGQVCAAAAILSVLALPWIAGAMVAGVGLLVGVDVALLGPVAGAGTQGCLAVLRGLLDGTAALGLAARESSAPSAGHLGLWAGGLVGISHPRGPCALGGGVALLAFVTVLRPGADSRAYDPLAPLLAAGDPMSGLSLAIVAAVLACVGVVAARPPLRLLTPAAATAAGVLGLAVAWRFGLPGLSALVAVFVVANALGRLPGARRHGARHLRQVLANGLPAGLGVGLHALGAEGMGALVFAGGLATLGADTCATEIGVRFGGTPRRLTRREPLAPGMSGGITAMGLVASGLGACIAPALLALLAGLPGRLALAVAGAGVVGALVDSLLGDTVQYRGLDPETGALVEDRHVGGAPSTPYSGYPWLDNDGVNLVSGLVGGAVAAFAGWWLA